MRNSQGEEEGHGLDPQAAAAQEARAQATAASCQLRHCHGRLRRLHVRDVGARCRRELRSEKRRRGAVGVVGEAVGWGLVAQAG